MRAPRVEGRAPRSRGDFREVAYARESRLRLRLGEPFSEENEPEPRQKASSQNPTASEPFTEKTVRKSPSSGKKQKPTVDSSQAEIAPDPADTPVDDGLPFTFSFLPTPQAADHPAAKEPIPAQACMDSSSPIPAAPKETFDEVSWIDTLGDFMKELEAPYDGPPHRPFPDFPDFTETREPELSSSSAPDTSNTDQAQTEPLPDIFSACTEPLTIPSHLWRGRSVPFPKRYAHVLCWFRPEYARRLREAFRQGTIPMGVMHYLRQIARAKAEERKHV